MLAEAENKHELNISEVGCENNAVLWIIKKAACNTRTRLDNLEVQSILLEAFHVETLCMIIKATEFMVSTFAIIVKVQLQFAASKVDLCIKTITSHQQLHYLFKKKKLH